MCSATIRRALPAHPWLCLSSALGLGENPGKLNTAALPGLALAVGVQAQLAHGSVYRPQG